MYIHNAPNTDQESVLSEVGEGDSVMTSQLVSEGTQKDTSDSVQLEKLLKEKRQHAALVSQTRVSQPSMLRCTFLNIFCSFCDCVRYQMQACVLCVCCGP